MSTKIKSICYGGDILTPKDVENLLGHSRSFARKGLMIVYHNQTAHERACGHCGARNGVGFSKFTVNILNPIALKMERNQVLTEKDYNNLFWKIPVHHKQVWEKIVEDYTAIVDAIRDSNDTNINERIKIWESYTGKKWSEYLEGKVIDDVLKEI